MADIISLNPIPVANDVDLVVGYIHNGTLVNDFFQSWMRFNMHNSKDRRISYSITSAKGLYLADNRNRVVRDFRDNYRSDLFLFIDTDIQFEPEVIYKLMDAIDPVERPIVSALYFTYYGQNPLSGSDIVPLWRNYTEGRGFEIIPKIYANEIQQVDAVGFGCVLIHRKALDAFVGRYDEDWTWFGHDPVMVDGKLMHLGEDYTFCKRAKDMGIPIFGHGDAIVTHHKALPLNLETVIRHNQADINYLED